MATQNYTVGELEKMVNSEDWHDRIAVVRQGCALDKLVDDENEHVRAAVAESAKEFKREDLLDKLINDKSINVSQLASALLADKC